jgi:hypothetical protein
MKLDYAVLMQWVGVVIVLAAAFTLDWRAGIAVLGALVLVVGVLVERGRHEDMET